MGWFNSQELFCSTLEMVADIDNQLINQLKTPVPTYGPTKYLYHTVTSLTTSLSRIQYADVYVDDIGCITRGDSTQQHRVIELVLLAFKDIYPSVSVETKDSVGLKKVLAGEGDWSQVKDILSWIMNTQDSTLQLSSKHISDLRSQIAIPPTQHRIRRKKLEILIGKLRSMYLAIPGVIRHLYYLQ